MIRKEGDKYLLYSADGSKLLGSFDSREQAEEREAEITRIAAAEGIEHMAAEQAKTSAPIELLVTEASVEIREPKGEAWLVRVIRSGFSKQPKPVPAAGIPEPIPWYYTAEAIKGAPEVFEGAPVYAFEVAPALHGHLGLSPDEKTRKGLLKHLVGTISQVKEAAGELLARLDLVKGAEWLQEKLADLAKKGRSDLVGLSIDSRVYGVPVQTAEGRAFAVLRFTKPATVDLATHPAAGGAFLRALETLGAKEVTMLKELLEKLRKRRPDLAAQLGENPTEEQVKEAFDKALGTAPPADGDLRPAEKALAGVRAAESRILLRERLGEAKMPKPFEDAIRKQFADRTFEPVELDNALRDAKSLVETRGTECRMLLKDRLAEAKLPPAAEGKLQKQFEGQIFEASALEAAIKAEKEYLDAVVGEGGVMGLGSTKAAVLLEQTQKLQIGMDRMFGVETKESEKVSRLDVPGFKGFRDAFQVVTGRDLVAAMNHVIADAREAILSTTWVNVLGTSMHRRLIKDYQQPTYREEAISRPRPGGVMNFKTQETLRVQYFGDLSEFDAEAQDFPEIAAPTDEKISYAVIQKGNILTITRKTLINDDLGAIVRMVGRLGRSARRTHAKFVWNFWINNSAYEVDAVAWFHATHSNLQSVALTADFLGATEIMNAITKLADQTEPGSGAKIGIDLTEPLWLAVPNALIGVALQLNISPQVPSGANLVANPVYQRFGAGNERIIVNPLFTDATDWGLFRSPDIVDSVEVGYLNDQREPEFFVANVPTVGQMFVADKLQHKIRHEYGADIVDFRGAVKAVVAG
jgi:hypothetical protein